MSHWAASASCNALRILRRSCVGIGRHRALRRYVVHVARRRNEIGIRMALGAERSRVLRMVLGEVAVLIVAGLALGLAAAISGTRFLASFLYRVEPNDPTTLAAACVILAASAVVAGFLPAKRAANVDPMTALREE
jgi:ABC-type antimicrobial peptide transport system permease subunit